MLEIKNWIAKIAFRIFLKYAGLTQEEYFRSIYLQEERARKNKANLKKQLKKLEL